MLSMASGSQEKLHDDPLIPPVYFLIRRTLLSMTVLFHVHWVLVSATLAV